MSRRIGFIVGWLILFNCITVFAEPRLEDLALEKYQLYETTTVDLHDAIKDPGNEYLIRCYANEELVDEQYGLFGNQLVSYTFKGADLVGKNVYLEIEGYNSTEKARIEKKILGNPNGSVEIKEVNGVVVADCLDFANTEAYMYEWYLNGELVSKESGYNVGVEDYGKSLFCVVTSIETSYSVKSNVLILQKDTVRVIGKTLDINKYGEWIHGVTGKWYLRKDGTHPVGFKDEAGILHYDWQMIDEKWYAFNELGYTVTGWIIDYDDNTYYLEDSLVSGWQFIDGNWYYFSELHDGTFGRMLNNCVTSDGYRLNEFGFWEE